MLAEVLNTGMLKVCGHENVIPAGLFDKKKRIKTLNIASTPIKPNNLRILKIICRYQQLFDGIIT